MTDASGVLRASLLGMGGELGAIVAAFAQAVGPQLAAHATPSRLQGGTLTVRCSSAAWAQTIALREQELVERLAPLLGDGVVRRIHARAGGIAPAPTPAARAVAHPPAAPPPPLAAGRERELEHLVAHIDDPTLRARVLDAARASERRRLDSGNSRS